MINMPLNFSRGLLFIFGGILILLYAYDYLDIKTVLVLIALYLIAMGLFQVASVYALRRFLKR